MSAGKYFLDTNIFVYSFDEKAPREKREKARFLIRSALEQQEGVVSFQVVQEFLNTATRKLPHILTSEDAGDYLRAVLMPLCTVYPEEELYREALNIHYKTKIFFYDSLIVASAISTGCKTLYSEDLQHGRALSGLHIRNPF